MTALSVTPYNTMPIFSDLAGLKADFGDHARFLRRIRRRARQARSAHRY